MIFQIKMTWTRVSCCLVYVCIGWFTCCLISYVSVVVAVPEIHFNASHKKGNSLLLDHGVSDGDIFSESGLSNCTVDIMMGL